MEGGEHLDGVHLDRSADESNLSPTRGVSYQEGQAKSGDGRPSGSSDPEKLSGAAAESRPCDSSAGGSAVLEELTFASQSLSNSADKVSGFQEVKDFWEVADIPASPTSPMTCSEEKRADGWIPENADNVVNMAPVESGSVNGQDKGATVKCAGCAKAFSQTCVLPQRANTVLLSLCDSCENITSAVFVCLRCGQESSSLADLRAHKQTHVVPEHRLHVCTVCGVCFGSHASLKGHHCTVSSAAEGALSERKRDDETKDRLPIERSAPCRKRKLNRKVRVEEIVNTLTKAVCTPVDARAPKTQRARKQTEPAKPSRSSTRTRVATKTFQASNLGQLFILKTPPTRRISTIKLEDKTPTITNKPQKRNLKPPKVFQCLDCPEYFMVNKEFRKHKLTHNSKETYPCTKCKKVFKSERILQRHEQIHLGLFKDHIFCDMCGKGFMTPQTLSAHMKTVHSDEKPFACDICNKSFKQYGNMKTHRRTHTGEKPFICQECGRSFAQMGNLQAHMVVHAASKPHVCKICNKSFSYLRSLQNHTRGTHTGERPFECPICQKTFSNPSVMREHKRIHSEKRGYLCDKCGKGFKSYKNLKQHEKFHLDVPPYTCEVCGKGFVWFKSFQLHKRTHTNEKPYACDQCKKVFSNINSFKKHKKKHLAGSSSEVPALPTAKDWDRPPEDIKPPTQQSQPSPPLALAKANQTVFESNAGVYSHATNEHGPTSGRLSPQARAVTTAPSDAPSLHHPLPPHTQNYGHVVFSQPFSTYVTSTGGDFTIL